MRSLAALLLVVSIAACGPSVRGTSQTGPDAWSWQRLTSSEFTAAHLSADLLSVLQQMRPQYLSRRGAYGAPGVVVYVDGIGNGDIGALRSVRASEVAEVRYLSGIDATNRFGAGHGHGVILVITRSGLRR